MRPLKVFWWPGGSGAGNFGDQLSPQMCAALARRPVVHAPVGEAELVAMGSVLEPRFWRQQANLGFGGVIWGSGRMFSEPPITFPKAHIAAVRGVLTAASLTPPPSPACALGDPGLLAALLAPLSRPRNKRYPLGVMPHWTERDCAAIKKVAKASSEILIIDPCAPVKAVLDNVVACDHILSSAMHGLIVADGLGIPNERLRLRLDRMNQRGLSEFKFRDYDSLWSGRQREPVELRSDETLDSLLARRWHWPPAADQIQQALYDSFPFA